MIETVNELRIKMTEYHRRETDAEFFVEMFRKL